MAKPSGKQIELTVPQLQFLADLNRNWVASGALQELVPTDLVAAHPFSPEVHNLRDGLPASFPFFVKDIIYWCLLAGNERTLQSGISALRSWIIPSFGWEEADSIASSGEIQRTTLAQLMLQLSPAGFFRWKSSRSNLQRIIGKLADIRRLERSKPEIVVERIPSLLELRQQFKLALATGDFQTAKTVVSTINKYELDTAANGAFMRIELNRAFGNPRDVVGDPELSNLVTTRVPVSVRNAIVEAFYAVFIEPFIEREDWRGAVDAYAASVHPSIGDLLRTVEVGRDVKVQRCLACLAVTKKDSNTGKRLQEQSKDAAVQALCGMVPTVDTGRSAPIELFKSAWEVQDWTAVQQLGVALLKDPKETARSKELVAQVLQKSLEVAPNADLRKFVSEETQQEAKPSLLQSWAEVATALKQGDFDKVLAFLNVENRLRLNLSRASEIDSLFALIGDLLTMPGVDQVHGVDLRDIIGSALIEDCIQDPGFPNAGLKDLYGILFDFWVSQRRKSGAISSETTFLLLAAGLLELDVDFSGVIFSAVLDWWNSRRNSKRVGFLVRSLEMLSGGGIPERQAKDLWNTAAQDILRFWSELSTSDRNAWISIGAQLQVSTELLTTFRAQAKPTERADPLASIKLNKIAIVSLNESAAAQAATQISQRINCEIVLVTDKTAGTATASALSADVILFVWRATKHAVYRAFDKVRNRLQYVTGTGATSIVSSLEQWATQQIGN